MNTGYTTLAKGFEDSIYIRIDHGTEMSFKIPVSWIGVSDFDNSLRFEVPAGCGYGIHYLFSVFSNENDPDLQTITRVAYDTEKAFNGWTVFKGIEKMNNGGIVVRMMQA